MLQRESSGHSPTDEDINAAGTLTPAPTTGQVSDALPNLVKLLASPDGPARTYALSLLIGLQNSADRLPAAAVPAANADAAAPVAAPVATGFSADTAKVLATAIPQIAAHLTDEVIPNPSLTTTVLGGFVPNPPAAVFPPLYAYLQRDGAIAGVGLEVVQDLLSYGVPFQSNPPSPSAVTCAAATRPRAPAPISSMPSAPRPTSLSHSTKLCSSILPRTTTACAPASSFRSPSSISPRTSSRTQKPRSLDYLKTSTKTCRSSTLAKAVASCWTAPHITGCPSYAP